MTVLVDPTNEHSPRVVTPARRLPSVAGAVIGLLDISKPRGDVFLGRVASHLESAGATVRHYRKPAFAKPAPFDLRVQIARECGAVIEALAD